MRVFYGRASLGQRAWMLCAALLQPAALLIDHGHFQYNNISLGLAVCAA
jgi:alpha-1,3-glucosyltransferase